MRGEAHGGCPACGQQVSQLARTDLESLVLAACSGRFFTSSNSNKNDNNDSNARSPRSDRNEAGPVFTGLSFAERDATEDPGGNEDGFEVIK